MTHNFMTGVWKKKQRTGADMLKFYHSPSVAQLNFLHEVASRHLGHPPSFGHPAQFPFNFPPAAPETWNFIRGATRQPVHEYARLMTSGTDTSKKASGLSSGIVDALSSAGRTALKYGGIVARNLIKHQETIRKGIKVGKDIADLSSLIGNITGLVSDDTHKKVTTVTSAVEGTVSRYGKQKSGAKKGGAWYDYDNL